MNSFAHDPRQVKYAKELVGMDKPLIRVGFSISDFLRGHSVHRSVLYCISGMPRYMLVPHLVEFAVLS